MYVVDNVCSLGKRSRSSIETQFSSCDNYSISNSLLNT
jgi:hypothetical protein